MSSPPQESHLAFLSSLESIQQQLSNSCDSLQSEKLWELMPDVHRLFLNSLQINKKLYDGIVGMQYSVKQESQAINSKILNCLRDMEEVYGKTQQLYEETVRQNGKSRYMVEEFTKPFREELRSKVDETSFILKMKMVLNEFDHLGHRISYDSEGRPYEGQNSHTFNFVKTEVLPLICRVEKQSQEVSWSITKQAGRVEKLEEKQEELRKQLFSEKQEIARVKSCLMEQLQKRLNEEVWKGRFQQFSKHLMDNSLNPISTQIRRNEIQFKYDLEDLKQQLLAVKRNDFNERIKSCNGKIQNIRVELEKLISDNFSESIRRLSNQMREMRAELLGEIASREKNAMSDVLERLEKERKRVDGKFQAITTDLNVQVEKIMANYDQGLSEKVLKLDHQSKSLHQSLKNYRKVIEKQHSQIHFIKDVLSKKANFSDVLIHVQGKADKHDYMQLKNLIGNKNAMVSDCSQEQLKFITAQQEKQETSSNKVRKRNSTSGRKNYQQNSLFTDADRDDSVKRYMLGLKNGVTNYTRENLLKEKTRFIMMNKTDRRQTRTGRTDTITDNLV